MKEFTLGMAAGFMIAITTFAVLINANLNRIANALEAQVAPQEPTR